MSNSRKYTAWDNSDREDFYSPQGKLEMTHVDRYDLGGKYKGTDVYDSHNKRIDSFKRKD